MNRLFICLLFLKIKKYKKNIIFSTVEFGRNYYQNFMCYIYIKNSYKLLKIIITIININIKF